MIANVFKQALREPLVHFLAAGSALFLVMGQFGGEDSLDRSITINEAEVTRLASQWEQTWSRPPSAQGKSGLEVIPKRSARWMGCGGLMRTTVAAGTRPEVEYAAPSWRRRGEADRTSVREDEEGARAPPASVPYFGMQENPAGRAFRSRPRRGRGGGR